MGHQDFGGICPIFNEVNEKEISFKIRTSGTISIDQTAFKFGREVTVIEAFAHLITGSLATTSNSATIGIYKATLSTRIGSIVLASASTGVSTEDCYPATVAGSVTSTSFTSTDILCIAMDAKATDTYPPCNVIIRYRDK